MPRFWMDAGVLGVLILALLLVVVIDKLVGSGDPVTPIQQPVVQPTPAAAKPLRLAVTESYRDNDGNVWDDMVKLLRNMGEGYKSTELNNQELHNSKKLAEFDVLFLTCAPPSKQTNLLADVLQKYVGDGGTLYASDWRYDDVAAAFPDIAARRLQREGKAQHVDANVVDAGLRDMLGRATIPLRFDLDKWKTAAFAGDRVKVLLEGNYQLQDSGASVAPLLVKFQFGKGTVIFTSFHNERQNSEIEQKLLKYLVFSAVTAQLESQVNQQLVQGGFSPQKQNLLSASQDNPKVTYAYRSTKAGKIRFVLGFEERGARLKLSVTNPEGRTIEKEGTKTFDIDAFHPEPAEWRYTVTALSVPFADFPFTVTVAESDGK